MPRSGRTTCTRLSRQVLAGILRPNGSRDATPGRSQEKPTKGGPRVVLRESTDGGRLPAWISRTCGCSRGGLAGGRRLTPAVRSSGDLETVTVQPGLLAARHVLGAGDSPWSRKGPTAKSAPGTRWGLSGVARPIGGQQTRRWADVRWPSCGSATRTAGCVNSGVSHQRLNALRTGSAGPGRTWWWPALAGSSGARVARRGRRAEQGRHGLVTVPADAPRGA